MKLTAVDKQQELATVHAKVQDLRKEFATVYADMMRLAEVLGGTSDALPPSLGCSSAVCQRCTTRASSSIKGKPSAIFLTCLLYTSPSPRDRG
eukprot:982798-Amphidinium_carterae.1